MENPNSAPGTVQNNNQTVADPTPKVFAYIAFALALLCFGMEIHRSLSSSKDERQTEALINAKVEGISEGLKATIKEATDASTRAENHVRTQDTQIGIIQHDIEDLRHANRPK